MESLDCPDASQFTPVRAASVTPQQALALLNDRFVVRYSEHFAERLRGERSNLESQIERAFQIALGRVPDPTEARRLAAYAEKHGLPNACRVLFNCNEFLFVE